MKQRIIATTLGIVMAFSSLAPAVAGGRASTRNILLIAAGLGAFVTNYTHKLRLKRQEHRETVKRQAAYRDWFYQKYGYYPTDGQFKKWYYETYGADPR